jgi:thiol:disulfide interchange protein DsbD
MLVCASLCVSLLPYSFGQNNNVLSVSPPPRVHAKRGQEVTAPITAELQAGFHVNSNQPADEYLIPLKLTWVKGPLETVQVLYPKPQMEHFAFSQKPVSIFSGKFEIVTKFKTAPAAQPGMALMNGKLRFQACNDRECLPPKTVDVQFTVDVQ